jgi:UDP-N-acetylmuramoyl-L-alanyl-D-glutamate--2,6-diaminopimelate ligase
MQLSELLGSNGDVTGIEIKGLAFDSRAVEPGYLFAAFPGDKADGRDFIPQALERGAVVVLSGPVRGDGGAVDTGNAVHLVDDNPRRCFAKIAARYYGRQPATIAAVTGTNGKSSVVSFVRQLWQALGIKAASIGTLGIEGDGASAEGGLTTPDPLTLHAALGELASTGVEHVAFEASSHGLAQFRLDGVQVRIAAFTNLTRDHLDYHQTLEGYLYAKARLFGELLPPDGAAIINLDSEFGPEIENLCWARGHQITTVGRGVEADIHLKGAQPQDAGQLLQISHDGQEYAVALPLLGAFQAENALMAAAIVIASGAAPGKVFAALAGLKGVPGRFEHMGRTPAGGLVIIDYAHTPDGLKNILHAARAAASGQLHLVFGCGGDRDKGKRPEMGAIAAELADAVYVTDDNPRSEDAATIRREILAAAPEASEFDDRAQAIASAAAALGQGDLLVVTGKGHETGQIVGNQVLPFDDAEVVRVAIKSLQEEARDAG